MRLFIKVKRCGLDFLENLALFFADSRFDFFAESGRAFGEVLLCEVRFVLDVPDAQKRKNCRRQDNSPCKKGKKEKIAS